MRVHVIGKRAVKGVGKDGNAYSYCIAYCEYEEKNTEGYAVEAVRLYSRVVNPDDVQVDNCYNLDRDSNGRVIGFELTK